jgi:hypothetical protein
MKPSASRIERMLEKIEARLVPPPRRCLSAIVHGDDEAEAKEKALAEHVACNGLGIMRACLETQKLEQLEARMDEIAHRVARDRTNAARERTSTDEAQRLTN